MKRAFLPLVLCFALAANAARAADDAPVILDAGTPAPSRGLFLPEQLAIDDAADRARLKAENEQYRKTAAPAWWIPVVVGVVALGLGVSAGYGVSEAAKKK